MSEGSRTMEIMRELGIRLGQPTIAVVGCGGAGNNIVDTMYWQCQGVHTVALNTDAKALDRISAHAKLKLGNEETCGLPEIGERCAEESASKIRSAIEGYEIVFVIAGLGGGAGTGIAPVVARIAQEEGAVVFAVPILPFSIEGKRRELALQALEQLKESANVVVPLDNDRLLGICASMRLSAAFKVTDQSILRIIEKVYEHSASYVSDMVDEISGGFTSVEDVVTAEHEEIVEDLPMNSAYADLSPSLEFPFNPAWDEMNRDWDEMNFS